MVGIDEESELQGSVERCRAVLQESSLHRIAIQAQGSLATPEDCFAALAEVTHWPESTGPLEKIASNIGAEPSEFARWLLLQSAIAAAPQVAACPVHEAVKRLWRAEVDSLLHPPAAWQSIFVMGNIRFREMARLMTLQRFPAGQFHWEVSGFPRSYIPHTAWQSWPRLLAHLAAKTRGFAPMVELHVNARRRNRLTLTESEGLSSCYLIAESLKIQPSVKGLFTASWLVCENTARISPQLAWFRNFFLTHGAFVASAGEAHEEAGFKTGSVERRQLYESGSYRPTNSYVLWPRQEILAWAKRFQPSAAPFALNHRSPA